MPCFPCTGSIRARKKIICSLVLNTNQTTKTNHMNTDNKTDSYRVQYTHNSRNTDTIKNTHVRKLTSIALMAIMVAGGLTFAIPGMEPAHAAQIDSNPHLKVSAEGQNADNEIAATNIVEVVVIDDLTDEVGNKPIVRVDGHILDVGFFSGAWYGYFASDDILGTGLVDDSDDDGIVNGDDQGAIDDLVTESPFGNLDTSTDDTNTQVLVIVDLGSTFDVVYERPGGNEKVSMEYDDPNSGASLDRTAYPRNTGVVVTIDDQALNVDPTAEDTWLFRTGADPIYGVDANIANVAATAQAQTDRDEKIENAKTARDNQLRDPAGDRDKKIADALDTLNEVKAAIAALPSLLTYAGDQDTDGDAAFVEKERREDVISAAETAYENVAGRGDKNVPTTVDANTAIDTDQADLNYRGSAMIEYLQIVGTLNDDGTVNTKGLSLIHISEPTDRTRSRMPSSA